MHQNLLNAGFVSVLYINDNRENVQESLVIKPLTKELPESIRDFAAHMPASNCIFGAKRFKGSALSLDGVFDCG
jgi:hypothetical protein